MTCTFCLFASLSLSLPFFLCCSVCCVSLPYSCWSRRCYDVADPVSFQCVRIWSRRLIYWTRKARKVFSCKQTAAICRGKKIESIQLKQLPFVLGKKLRKFAQVGCLRNFIVLGKLMPLCLKRQFKAAVFRWSEKFRRRREQKTQGHALNTCVIDNSSFACR